MGTKTYITGVHDVVLFPYTKRSAFGYGIGIPWKGVTSITISEEGGEPTPIYADDTLYCNIVSHEEIKATIEAYDAPLEFNLCDGTRELNGVQAGQQNRTSFCLAFKTRVGSENGTDAIINTLDYKIKDEEIHFLYCCRASPADKQYQTDSTSSDPMSKSWSITCSPPPNNTYWWQDTSIRPNHVWIRSSEFVTNTATNRQYHTLSNVIFSKYSFVTPMRIAANYNGVCQECMMNGTMDFGGLYTGNLTLHCSVPTSTVSTISYYKYTWYIHYPYREETTWTTLSTTTTNDYTVTASTLCPRHATYDTLFGAEVYVKALGYDSSDVLTGQTWSNTMTIIPEQVYASNSGVLTWKYSDTTYTFPAIFHTFYNNVSTTSHWPIMLGTGDSGKALEAGAYSGPVVFQVTTRAAPNTIQEKTVVELFSGTGSAIANMVLTMNNKIFMNGVTGTRSSDNATCRLVSPVWSSDTNKKNFFQTYMYLYISAWVPCDAPNYVDYDIVYDPIFGPLRHCDFKIYLIDDSSSTEEKKTSSKPSSGPFRLNFV